MKKDPGQYTNLIKNPEYAQVAKRLQKKMAAKLTAIRQNDLEKPASRSRSKARSR